MVKDQRHARLLACLQPGRQHEGVFPTAYRHYMLRDIRPNFADVEDCSYFVRGDPACFDRSELACGVLRMLNHLTLSWFSDNILVFLRRKQAGRSNMTWCPQHAGILRDRFWVAKVPVRGTVVG